MADKLVQFLNISSGKYSRVSETSVKSFSLEKDLEFGAAIYFILLLSCVVAITVQCTTSGNGVLENTTMLVRLYFLFAHLLI